MRKLKILVVDDDLGMRTTYQRLLAKIPLHEVVIASDGKEAYEKICEADPSFDLVITDFNMPVMNGGELATALMKTHPEIPVIMITGGHTGEIQEFQKKYHLHAILDKPIEVAELLDIISQIATAC